MESRISAISQPFDPTQIEVETSTATINTLLGMLKANLIDLQPDFQRQRDLWNERKKSRLIESIILGLPLPSFYFELDRKNKKWIVIDGLQRLCAINDFMTGRLRLSNLEFLDEVWQGVTYDSMPHYDQVQFGLRQINLNVLKGATPPNVKFIIFQRLNTAGLALTPAEIRNALFRGKCLELIKELLPELHGRIRGISETRMNDHDYVMRYLAHMVSDYNGNKIDEFLCNVMPQFDQFDDAKIESLRQSFVASLDVCIALLGDQAFRTPSAQGKKNKISKALFECMMVEISRTGADDRQKLLARKDLFAKRYRQMFSNPELSKTLSGGTGKSRAVNKRFAEIRKLIDNTIRE